MASHPHAFLLGGCNLIADALPCDLSLKLSEGKKDIQSEPPHGCCGVELLRYGDEANALFIEGFDYGSGISKIPLLVYIAQNKKMAHSEIRIGHLAVRGEPYGSNFNL
jgi:hypothetical protein